MYGGVSKVQYISFITGYLEDYLVRMSVLGCWQGVTIDPGQAHVRPDFPRHQQCPLVVLLGEIQWGLMVWISYFAKVLSMYNYV